MKTSILLVWRSFSNPEENIFNPGLNNGQLFINLLHNFIFTHALVHVHVHLLILIRHIHVPGLDHNLLLLVFTQVLVPDPGPSQGRDQDQDPGRGLDQDPGPDPGPGRGRDLELGPDQGLNLGHDLDQLLLLFLVPRTLGPILNHHLMLLLDKGFFIHPFLRSRVMILIMICKCIKNIKVPEEGQRENKIVHFIPFRQDTMSERVSGLV